VVPKNILVRTFGLRRREKERKEERRGDRGFLVVFLFQFFTALGCDFFTFLFLFLFFCSLSYFCELIFVGRFYDFFGILLFF
jgi:hypothetical protein